MECSTCEQKAITTKPALCKEHFDAYVLENVQETIDRFDLVSKNQTICVAVSGGKDSLALVHILLRLGYSVEGLFIHEGISNYREHSVEDLDLFSTQHNFTLRTISFEQEFGFTLDEAIATKKYHPCTICGTLRRYLLNKYASTYPILATGHNLDDESQTVLINLARGNTSLMFRSGPKTEDNDLFVSKIKPFYFLSEKHVLTYTYLQGIRTQFGECPYANVSYRAQLRDILNTYEEKHVGCKKNILEHYLFLKTQMPTTTPQGKGHLQRCQSCGEASQEDVCKTCQFVKDIQTTLKHTE